MSARLIDLDSGTVRETSDAQFFEAVFGHPPRARDPRAIEEYRARARREFEEETAAIRHRTKQMLRRIREERGACVQCGATPVREVLDGDPLCQSCCDAWVRGERDAA